MILALFTVAFYLLNILTIVVIVQVVLSWLVSFNVVNLHQPFVRAIYVALERITDPLYRPIRKVLPDLGGIDFSPIVLLILIRVVMILLGGAYSDVSQALL